MQHIHGAHLAVLVVRVRVHGANGAPAPTRARLTAAAARSGCRQLVVASGPAHTGRRERAPRAPTDARSWRRASAHRERAALWRQRDAQRGRFAARRRARAVRRRRDRRRAPGAPAARPGSGTCARSGGRRPRRMAREVRRGPRRPIGAHQDHERALRVGERTPLELVGHKEPRPGRGGHDAAAVCDRLDGHTRNRPPPSIPSPSRAALFGAWRRGNTGVGQRSRMSHEALPVASAPIA
jgi:hypothetical protein